MKKKPDFEEEMEIRAIFGGKKRLLEKKLKITNRAVGR
jgi:hypothetical protein